MTKLTYPISLAIPSPFPHPVVRVFGLCTTASTIVSFKFSWKSGAAHLTGTPLRYEPAYSVEHKCWA